MVPLLPKILLLLSASAFLYASVSAQSPIKRSIAATTVGNINGVKVAVSGVTKESGKGKVVHLTLNGKESLRGVGKGQVVDFAGQQWKVVRVKKPCFGKGSIEFMQQ